jgi:hypothetical protein
MSYISDDEWKEIAKDNIDKHLGDVVEELDPQASEEEIEAQRIAVQEQAYVLAHDAMMKEGCSPETASRIARQISKEYGTWPQ